MAFKERKQITGTTAQINAYEGHEGQIVWDKEKKTFVGMSGTVGKNYPLAPKAYVDNEVQKVDTKLESKEDKGTSYNKADTDKKINEIIDIVVGSIPWYQRDSMFTTAKRSVTVPAGTQVTINGKFYVTTTPKTVNLPVVGNGKDVYLYACESSTREPTFVISANSTVPDGYTAQNSRKIGGFHTLCANVGTISGHNLSGYVAGDIIPYSAWDLKHRPVSEVEGMVWVAPINKWVQIYLPSWSGSKLVSRFNGVIVDGASAHKLHGEGFAYEAGLANCQLISRDEFMIAMRGVPECVNIRGGNDPNTTGGHVATNGQRIISNYGVEDGAGVIWQWSRDCAEFYPGATWNSTNFYLSGYSWQEKSVYNPDFDPVKRGSCLGLLRRFLLGAGWGDRALSGSRSVGCLYFSSGGWADFSARLVAEPLAIGY